MAGTRSTDQDDAIALGSRAVVSGVLGLCLLVLLLRLLPEPLPAVVGAPPAVLLLSFGPGVLLLLGAGWLETADARSVAYAFGTSLVSLLLLGLALNLALPPLGVTRPLALAPVAGGVAALLLALAAWALRGEPPTVRIPAPRSLSPVPLFCLLLPLASVLGVSVLNRTGDNTALLAVMALLAVFPVVVWKFVTPRWHALAIWSLGAAVLYHDALSAGRTFPGNPVVVRVWKAGRWEPGVEGGSLLATELLQHGSIFPILARLSGVDITTQLVVVNPFLVSLVPVALFCAFRAYVPSDAAFLSATVFVFAHPFYNQFPTAGRSATPVLFLSVFALALSDTESPDLMRSLVALGALSGVVFTHYGTSYFVMSAIVTTTALLLLLGVLDRRLDITGRLEGVSVRADGDQGVTAAGERLLQWPLAAFFTVVTFSWYLFTNGSRAFELFPRHLESSLEQLLTGTAGPGAGRTAARLGREYGSPSIRWSKYVYVAIAAFIALGLAVTFVRRLRRPERERPDDQFLLLGLVTLGVFGATFLVRTWGGGRPMMIAFVFSLPFAALGVHWLSERVDRAVARSEGLPGVLRGSGAVVPAVFAVLVAALFVLNSGLAAATVLPGTAPSTVPLSDGESTVEYDTTTHAWLVDHKNDAQVYGDYIAFGQTDWTAAAIAAKTESGTLYGGSKPRGDVAPLADPGVESGYLLLLSHNVRTEAFDHYSTRMSLSTVRPEYRQNVVYSSGHTRVYYFG